VDRLSRLRLYFFLWRFALIRFLRLCLLIFRFRVFRPQGTYSFLRVSFPLTGVTHLLGCRKTKIYKTDILAPAGFVIKLNSQVFFALLLSYQGIGAVPGAVGPSMSELAQLRE